MGGSVSGNVSRMLEQPISQGDIELLLALRDSQEREAAIRPAANTSAAPRHPLPGSIPSIAPAGQPPRAAEDAAAARPPAKHDKQQQPDVTKRAQSSVLSEADCWVASLSRRQVQAQLQRLTCLLDEHKASLRAMQHQNMVLKAQMRLLETLAQTRLDQMSRLVCPLPKDLLRSAVAVLSPAAAAGDKPGPLVSLGSLDSQGSVPDLECLTLLYKAAVEELSLAIVTIPSNSPALVARIEAVIEGIRPVYEQLCVRSMGVLLRLGTRCIDDGRDGGDGRDVPPPEDRCWQLVCHSLFLSQAQAMAFAQLHRMYCVWSDAVVRRRRELCSYLGESLTGASQASALDSDRDPEQLVAALYSNIIQERCLLSLVAEVLCFKVLRPLQLAMLMMASFPFPCDAPTLLHAMAYHGPDGSTVHHHAPDDSTMPPAKQPPSQRPPAHPSHGAATQVPRRPSTHHGHDGTADASPFHTPHGLPAPRGR